MQSARQLQLQRLRAADAGALGGPVPEEQPYEYKPFPRLRERNPHRWVAYATIHALLALLLLLLSVL